MPPTIESGDPSLGASGSITVSQGSAGVTPWPVSVSSIALPSGAATSAKQDTGNASLASVDSKTPALISGRVPVDGSGVSQPVTQASAWTVSGPLTDAQLRASAVPVSGPLTDAQLRAVAVPVSGPLTDSQLRASAVPISTAQLPSALVGGRLDTNNGAWLGSTAPTVGQKTMANSIPVAFASDQTVVTTTPSKPGTATQTSVAAANADTLLLSANASRLGAVIANDSSGSLLYVLLGTGAASASNFNYVLSPLQNGIPGVLEVPFGYTGQIRGFWLAAIGNARISELT